MKVRRSSSDGFMRLLLNLIPYPGSLDRRAPPCQSQIAGFVVSSQPSGGAAMPERTPQSPGRRGFLRRFMIAGGAATAAVPAAALPQGRGSGAGEGPYYLPKYCRSQSYTSLKQSSYDRTGGNADRWPIKAGATQELFNAAGPGAISHIWFTIAAPSMHHLKELVLRAYWDGNTRPSVETPVGDFFGLNLGEYVIYESEYLACSPGRSLNCYFTMPYRKSALMTVTNEGKQDV